MKKKVKGVDVEKYIQEVLLALVPRYREGAGETVVFTLKGRYEDPRGVPWLIERLASYYSVNLPELRRRCRDLLKLRHYISLPLSENLVLLPAKLRQSVVLGETTAGYLNLQQIAEILPAPPAPSPAGRSGLEPLNPVQPKQAPEKLLAEKAQYKGKIFSGRSAAADPPFSPERKESAWLSRVQFKCGLQLETLNTPETLRERLRQGEVVRQDFLQRRRQGATFVGLSRQALLDQLPNCNCILKDIFIEFCGLKLSKLDK